jgi:putative membrane protein
MLDGTGKALHRRFGARRPIGRAAGPALGLAAALWTAAVVAAHAHGGTETSDAAVWSDWPVSADILIPTVLVGLVYGAGMVRRSAATLALPWWRPVMFFSGLAAVFLALQSPIDPIADHLFFVHQIQHLLLRMVGPMLLVLAWPEGLLTAGLPPPVRRMLLAPVVSAGATRRVFAALAQPVTVTVLFIGVLCFWEIPRFHDAALLDEPLHYLMHVTMLLAGLLFWWRVFDRRPPPQGAPYGVRLMMLWVVILSNIILGGYTTLKTTAIYPAYDVLGRWFGYAPRADEALGGIIIWIVSSMIAVMAVLVVIHLWGRHEARLDDKRTGGSAAPVVALPDRAAAAALVVEQRSKNRILALGFAAFVVTIFVTAILFGVMSVA